MFSQFAQALRLREQDGRFSLSLLVSDSGIATWLLLSHHVFLDLPAPTPSLLVTASIILATLAWLCGLHRDWVGRGTRFALSALLFLILAAALLPLYPGNDHHWLLQTSSSWLATALLAGYIFGRAILWKLREVGPWAPLEGLRWLLLGSIATWVLWPAYSIKPNGAGDSYWYVMMLSDYLAQLRSGIFPVWIGQTEYAFNGAFSPLRLAPGFQHVGGVIDLLTRHTLDFMAVKNSVLALAALASGFSAYFCMRAILPTRSNLAVALALAYLLSPGLLSPLIIGDQYMTFLAAPFLPVVLYGCWRSCVHNDILAHLYLGAGTAALWLFHTPVALWTSFFAAGLYAIKFVIHRRSGHESKMMGLALLAYLLLGSYPILSALSLDNVVEFSVAGVSIFAQAKNIFPAILEPISSIAGAPSNYQPGYAVLAVGLAGIGLATYLRNPVALSFAAASLLLIPLILPVPGLSPWIWNHTPAIVLKITNIWAFQRLSLIWVALLLFTLAAAVAALPAKTCRFWMRLGIFLVAAGALVWSGHEASRLRSFFAGNIPVGTVWKILAAKHNLVMTRYAYSSFQSTPPYFSHAYMDPYLESRLLDRTGLQVLLTNYDSAASTSIGGGSTLVASGLLRAFSDNNSVYYQLKPALTINPNRHYALRLDFLNAGEQGHLQVMGDQLFREYILPDSGFDMGKQSGPPQSFGSTPTSSHVVPLYTNALGPVQLQITNILPNRPITPEFDCARFHLWEYEPTSLPINVRTLLPYRARVESPASAYLETPRLWLNGYRAIANGKRLPVLRSPSNLCMIAVEAGASEVELKYAPPLYIEVSYWLTIWGWGGLLILIMRELFFQRKPQML